MPRKSILATVKRSYSCELCGEQISHDVVRVDEGRSAPRAALDSESKLTTFSHATNKYLTEIDSSMVIITSLERS
jgi:hypothetical protein